MKLFKITDKDLLTNAYAPDKHYVVGALIGAAISVGSSLYGAKKSADAEKKARQMEAEQHARNQAYFNRRYNEDYADTAAGQNLMRQARDYADENWKKAQGAAAVGGGTDAATAMAKEAGNKVVSDTLANMAAQDTARKDSVDQQRFSEENNYQSQLAGHERQRGANIANVASAMGNAVGSIASSVGDSISEVKAEKQAANLARANSSADTALSNAVGVARANTGIGADVARELGGNVNASQIGAGLTDEEKRKMILA